MFVVVFNGVEHYRYEAHYSLIINHKFAYQFGDEH